MMNEKNGNWGSRCGDSGAKGTPPSRVAGRGWWGTWLVGSSLTASCAVAGGGEGEEAESGEDGGGGLGGW